MDEGTTNAEGTPGSTAAAGDEAASGTADAGPAAETTDGATPGAEGWAAQLQRMIDDIGRQAVPVIREVCCSRCQVRRCLVPSDSDTADKLAVLIEWHAAG